ncbi:MAG: acyl-CoA dehydrogenase, partial [Proteobacteria bacterium]|nr:acyl-CoA dehydrogenase [Pseudomonadota bacterium]
TLGELFTLIAYGQLIIENSLMYKIDNDIVDRIFDFMIRDFSKYALQLYSKPGSTKAQMELCMKMIDKPVADEERFKKVWEKYVYPLKGAYQMNE